MRISVIDQTDADAYQAFVQSCPHALYYVSLEFKELLSSILEAKAHYLALKDNHGNIRAVMPALIASHNEHGSILNSLPFFGSNGGVITNEDNPDLVESLLAGFEDLAIQHGCEASTIIVSPFDRMPQLYENNTFDYRDSRIGQITMLPTANDEIEQHLFSLYSGVRRTDIRKARKEGVHVEMVRSIEALRFIEETHNKNMATIGGQGKPAAFYRALEHQLESNDSCRMFIASKDDTPVAGLLNMYHNNTVEFFIPATRSQYRYLQAMSLCIHHAMIDAVKRGFTAWNWGGTWHSQDGVYKFKSKWGTQDIEYNYYTRIYNNNSRLKKLNPAELFDAFPYFFVMPYEYLECNTARS